MLTFNKRDVEFTQSWWYRCLDDKDKMAAWLQKLQNTEIGGYKDYTNYISMFEMDERTKRIYENIALDEMKHSNILLELMAERGIHPKPAEDCISQYWSDINAHIHDLQTASAVNYYGEALAAFRFEVIMDMRETPRDIRDALRIILPDEQFHRTTLMRLSGDALEPMRVMHETAVAVLKAPKITVQS